MRKEKRSLKKILLVFGTRPEAIKMCPLVAELKLRSGVEVSVCVTGQHREMLGSVLDAFFVKPDYDLSIMREGQTLFDVTQSILLKMRAVIEQESPDLVLVHGDTATTFATALAAFYLRVPIGHVEAGLRTNNIYSPYPEEFYRRAVAIISKYNFAPTERARDNLIFEGYSRESVFVVGNTVIDALRTTVRGDYRHQYLDWSAGGRLIILTAHRRESIGAPLKNIFKAVRRIADDFDDVRVIYPVHMNPAVRKIASEELLGCDRIKITEPLDVIDFHNLLARCYLAITDSGGIQEEAPALGKPVLVVRDRTERPEGVESGGLRLVGTDEDSVYRGVRQLLEDKSRYEAMSRAVSPYGDGYASKRIADIICESAFPGKQEPNE